MSLEIGDKIQWIKGENFGKNETISALENGFVKFESGGQIYLNVFPEFMQKIDENSDILIEPQDVLSTRVVDIEKDNSVQTIKEQIETKTIKSNIKPNSNIESILTTFNKSAEKLDENNRLDIIMQLEGLPDLNVVKMMYSVFEEEDVDKAFLIFLEEKIEKIITQIGRTIKDQADV